MLEYKSVRVSDAQEHWIEMWLAEGSTSEECDFGNNMIRIDGTVYYYRSKEFKKAFDKEYVWQKLQNFWPPSLEHFARYQHD